MPAEKTAEEIRNLGRKAWVIRANIGKIDDIEKMAAELVLRLDADGISPGLDFLIHNAASGFNRPIMEQKPKGWDWTMDINARSLLFMVQKFAPLMEMRGGGSIVSISSPGSLKVLPDYSVVGASKAALESLTRYLAVELAPQNINANVVSPGMVLTDALKHFDILREEELIIDRTKNRTPAGRLVIPEDVAGVVGFLCTPAANMIRGQTIIVDGGYSLSEH